MTESGAGAENVGVVGAADSGGEVGKKRPLEEEAAVVEGHSGEEIKRVKLDSEAAADSDPQVPENKAGDDKPAGEDQLAASSVDTSSASAALPKPELEVALKAAASATGEKIEIGTRIEVRWEVVDDENEEEEGSSVGVWWGCQIAELTKGHEEFSGVFRLEYDRKEVEGKTFDAEEREVAFCGPNMLVDVESERECIGGGNKGFMHWRVEGQTDSPRPLMAAADRVKAKGRGGDDWILGVISELHPDGTYDVLYDDGDEETHLKAELIEPVEEDLNESDDTVADSIDSFFELFVEQLMGGDMYKRLPPEKQRVAADKVNALRPLVREELEAIIEERGPGATVTGEDMAELIPRVMARAQQGT